MPDATVNAEEISIAAVVIRCGCGDPLNIHGWDNGELLPCPKPAGSEDRGVIAYYHKNPIKRWAWHLRNRR